MVAKDNKITANNKINTILYDKCYLENCKTITFEKKIQIIQNIDNLMFEVIFTFSNII